MVNTPIYLIMWFLLISIAISLLVIGWFRVGINMWLAQTCASVILRYDTDLCMFAQRAYANFDESHDYIHAVRVLENTLSLLVPLALFTGHILSYRQLKTVVYAAVLHDTYDHKYDGKGTMSRETINNWVLTKLGVDGVTCIRIIDNMSWSKRRESHSLDYCDHLRRLVQSADWIEALGEVGLHRCIMYTKMTHPEATPEQIRADVVKHIDEKLLMIPNELPAFACAHVYYYQLLDPLIVYKNMM